MTTFTLIRHGQSQSNANPWNHQPDSGLTDRGREEVYSAAAKLRKAKFHHLYSSSQLRAKQTAAILQHQLGLEHTVREELHEKLNRSFPFDAPDPRAAESEFQAFLNSMPDEERWNYRVEPDKETDREATERLLTALSDIAQAHPDQHLLVVSHGNLMRNLLVHLGHATFQQARVGTMKNAGFILLEWGTPPTLLKVDGFTPFDTLSS